MPSNVSPDPTIVMIAPGQSLRRSRRSSARSTPHASGGRALRCLPSEPPLWHLPTRPTLVLGQVCGNGCRGASVLVEVGTLSAYGTRCVVLYRSRFMPCPQCGASVERAGLAGHECSSERLVAYQM